MSYHLLNVFVAEQLAGVVAVDRVRVFLRDRSNASATPRVITSKACCWKRSAPSMVPLTDRPRAAACRARQAASGDRRGAPAGMLQFACSCCTSLAAARIERRGSSAPRSPGLRQRRQGAGLEVALQLQAGLDRLGEHEHVVRHAGLRDGWRRRRGHRARPSSPSANCRRRPATDRCGRAFPEA